MTLFAMVYSLKEGPKVLPVVRSVLKGISRPTNMKPDVKKGHPCIARSPPKPDSRAVIQCFQTCLYKECLDLDALKWKSARMRAC